jgi:hypothetical protein
VAVTAFTDVSLTIEDGLVGWSHHNFGLAIQHFAPMTECGRQHELFGGHAWLEPVETFGESRGVPRTSMMFRRTLILDNFRETPLFPYDL